VSRTRQNRQLAIRTTDDEIDGVGSVDYLSVGSLSCVYVTNFRSFFYAFAIPTLLLLPTPSSDGAEVISPSSLHSNTAVYPRSFSIIRLIVLVCPGFNCSRASLIDNICGK